MPATTPITKPATEHLRTLGAQHRLWIAIGDGVQEAARGERDASTRGRAGPVASTPIAPVWSEGTSGVR
jgi:hypothetical protein